MEVKSIESALTVLYGGDCLICALLDQFLELLLQRWRHLATYQNAAKELKLYPLGHSDQQARLKYSMTSLALW